MRTRLALVALGVLACTSTPNSSTDAGLDATPPPAPVTLADGLTVSEIAFYETVKIDVVKDGADIARYNAPLLTGRKGIVRAFLTLASKRYKARPLAAELHIVASAELVLKDAKTLRGAPVEDDLTSTFTFSFEEAALDVGSSFFLTVKDLAASGAPGAEIRYPASGAATLDVTRTPGRVRVRLVPVRYLADSSGRLPDTGPSTVDLLHTWLFDLFPTTEVDIDVRQPIDWASPVSADGSGWPELLQTLLDVRAQDAPQNDIYYVGLFQPKATFAGYCQSGCVAGLASTAAPAAPGERGVLAVGYGGTYMNDTIAHELAHTMGRMHAPCGSALGVDPKFPYPGGEIGVPGWRQSDQSPVIEASDVMSYCQPYWISDYTYAALANRIRVVNAQGFGQSVAHSVQRIVVSPDHHLTLGATLWMREVMGGQSVSVFYFDGSGELAANVTGLAYGYDHLPGGFVLVVDPPVRWSTLAIPALSPDRLVR